MAFLRKICLDFDKSSDSPKYLMFTHIRNSKVGVWQKVGFNFDKVEEINFSR